MRAAIAQTWVTSVADGPAGPTVGRRATEAIVHRVFELMAHAGTWSSATACSPCGIPSEAILDLVPSAVSNVLPQFTFGGLPLLQQIDVPAVAYRPGILQSAFGVDKLHQQPSVAALPARLSGPEPRKKMIAYSVSQPSSTLGVPADVGDGRGSAAPGV